MGKAASQWVAAVAVTTADPMLVRAARSKAGATAVKVEPGKKRGPAAAPGPRPVKVEPGKKPGPAAALAEAAAATPAASSRPTTPPRSASRTTYVNDASTLNDIKARFVEAACPMDPGCRGIFCTSPGTGVCAPIDSGDFCD